MLGRLGPGPVFVYESLIAARRWQVYATRAGFVLALLLGLSTSWLSLWTYDDQTTIQQLAAIGQGFFYTIATVQIVVVLLVAPAATAGAICQERARGSLTHMLVTDLSNAEIILGKLAARLVPVLALVFAGIPVLALVSLLGGIIPETLGLLTLESLAVATLGCSLALAVSVRAKKSHEVLMMVYAIFGAWVLGPVFWMVFEQTGIVEPLPDFLHWLNPIELAWAPYWCPGEVGLAEYATFFGMTLGGSLILACYAMARLRSEIRSTTTVRRPGFLGRLNALRPGPKLDPNPVLWREWHRNRPSRMAWIVWALYYVIAIGGAATLVYSTGNVQHLSQQLGEFTAMHLTLGLLLVGLSAPCALAEERVRGGLDVLLATPLSTASVVMAKWRGAFRKVPGLLVVPVFCSFYIAVVTEKDIVLAVTTPASGGAAVPSSVIAIDGWDRLASALISPLLLFAQATLLTTLGLALAVWIKKVGRAITVSVIFSLTLAIGPLLVAELGITQWVIEACGLAPPVTLTHIAPNQLAQVGETSQLEKIVNSALIGLSAFGGPYASMAITSYQELGLKTIWAVEFAVVGGLLALSAMLYGLVLLTFNRCLGRVPERPRPTLTEPIAPIEKTKARRRRSAGPEPVVT